MGDLSAVQCGRNRKSCDVPSRNLFLLLSDRYFTGTYLGNFPVHTVYFFRCFVYCDRSSAFVCIYRWLCGDERDRLFSWRKYFYHILYQSFHFPCLCSHISGSSAASYVCDPDQDEMDGLCIRTAHCVGYRILSSSRALGGRSADRSITFKLCDLLFQYPGYEPLQSEGNSQEAAV